MTDEVPGTADSTRAALERLAGAFALQKAETGRDDRERLIAEFRAVTSDKNASDAVRSAAMLLAGPPNLRRLVLRAPAAEVAAVLDTLATPTGDANDQEDGHHSDAKRVSDDGPIATWGQELQGLARRSGQEATDIARSISRHGFHSALTQLDSQVGLDDPLLAESTVDALGGRWVEGSYRSLYRAARREWTRRTDVDRVERGLSGLVAVNSLTPEFAAEQLQPPIHALPMVRGRDDAMHRIGAALDGPDRRVQVLVGEAGYGKSTVALAVAQRTEAKHTLALWVPASDRDALVEGLELAAVRTGATVYQIEAARSAAAVEQPARLWALLDESPRPWLLVLDDAGEAAVGSPDWVHPSHVGAVLITSRSGPDGWGADAEVISVAALAPDDGGQVVLDRLGADPDRRGVALARELSGRLAGMPLALASAGLLAASTAGASLAAVVERLRKVTGAGPLQAVYETGLQIGPVPSAARATLRLLACFAADEPLPMRVLGSREPVTGLIGAGLVEALPRPQHGLRCLRVHPAIAEHSRRDDAFDENTTRSMAEQAVGLLRAELTRLDAGLAADWPVICLLEPHVSAMIEFSTLDGDDLQAAVLGLVDATAEALVRAGRQRAAVALLDRALDATKGLGEPHPARLSARCTAAWMMAFDRDLRTAELLLQNVAEDCDRWLGVEHPHTLTARDCVARLRAERGAVEAGRAELARVLVVRRRVLGDEHRQTLATWQRLAWVSALCRREQYATGQLREILRIRLALHGPYHLDVFSTRYRLAWMLVRQGDLAQAEQEFRVLREDLRRVVGDQHPLTLMVRVRIGWVLKRRKRFTAARRTYIEVLGDQIDVLGHGHPRVLRTQHLLACLDLQLGRAAKAAHALRSVVDDREMVLGPDHQDTLISRSYLAWALHQAGDSAAAEREFEAVLADRVRVYGPRHPLTLMTRGLQARVLIKRGKLREAERRLERLYVDEINLLGPDHRLVFETRHALAVVAAMLGRPEEGETGLREVLADRRRVLGPDHPDTLAGRAYIVWVLGLRGQLEKAATACSDVIADRERVLGPTHPHTLNSRYRAAWLAGLAGRWDDSLARARDAQALLDDALGERHPDSLRCHLWIARSLRLLGRLNEAEREARKVLVAQSRVQGAAAVDTLRAREELVLILQAGGIGTTAATTLAALVRDRQETLGADHPDTIRSLALWTASTGRAVDHEETP